MNIIQQTGPSDDRPIGIFDSGIGGVSVLNCFVDRFPQENYIYCGDTARLPYGNKSPETIQRYCEQILDFLLKQNVKMVVVACNTASTQIKDKTYKGIPVIEMISSGLRELLKQQALPDSQTLLLATRSTILSGSYQQRLLSSNASIQLKALPCPLFVPLVEEGLLDHQITDETMNMYFSEQEIVKNKTLSSVILGCTHYPFLQPSLEKYFSSQGIHNIRFIDCGMGAAETFAENHQIEKNKNSRGTVRVCLTDYSDYFEKILQKLARFQIDSIQTIQL